MISPDQLTALVSEIFDPRVADPDDPKADKCRGFLIGVTLDKARYFFCIGDIILHSGKPLPKYQDIVFFIGSNSKIFTATLLPLAASGAKNPVGPQTPVEDLLPANVTFNQPNGQVLLWHLATHSAGFPTPVCGPRPRFGDYPFTSLGQFLADFQPPYPPGQYWQYSNPAFALLGDVLSHAYQSDGRSTYWDATYKQWPSLVVQQITRPLGMDKTQVGYAERADVIAQGYNYTDHGGTYAYTPVDPPTWSLQSAGLGAGALSSTLDDMLAFLEAQIDPPAGDLGDAITATQEPWPSSDALSMGLGWQRSDDYFDKNGELAGYNTYMAFDPGAKVGVFVFGNTDRGAAGAAVDGGGRILLGKIRGTPAQRSVFPKPPTTPECPN